ncbi:glycosyltransferase [Enterococcus saccharolyticus]|uniref:glycosyltransferase n=1 Tax=Enterococcus saccharolyticus TaxID=41997 RepID=UPI0039E10EB4
MKKFSFIILHYNTFKETINCIECIKKLEYYDEVKIIIVNNNSTDDSLSKLKKIYNSSEIDFLDSEYNAGFAKGNNLGYSLAKHKYNSKFVICLNSDVYIKQIDFLSLIEAEFEDNQFDLLGPKISTLDGDNQNPVKYIHDTNKKVNRTLFLNKLRYIKSFLPEKYKNKKNYQKKTTEKQRMFNIPLHGACIIIGPKYISKHEYLFYPDTFLYGEEDILYYLSKINNEKLVYSPFLKVIHAEDASTNNEFGTENGKKKRFVLKHSENSLKILKLLIKKYS